MITIDGKLPGLELHAECLVADEHMVLPSSSMYETVIRDVVTKAADHMVRSNPSFRFENAAQGLPAVRVRYHAIVISPGELRYALEKAFLDGMAAGGKLTPRLPR